MGELMGLEVILIIPVTFTILPFFPPLDANGNVDLKESPQRWLGGGSGGPFVSQLVSGRILNILRL
jgi:hypothetical protein